MYSFKQVPIKSPGFGSLSLTMGLNAQPFSQSVPTLNYVRQKYGVKFFNGGEFYNPPDKPYLNIELLREFCKVAEDKDLVISIKGAFDVNTFTPDGTKEGIDKSINRIVSYFEDLPVKPKLLYEMARVDPKVPIAESVGYIAEHVNSGAIDGICLSEVSAKSIEAAAKAAPISAIEIEMSILTQDAVDNGILEAASKYKIPIIPYSPLCKGLLTDFCVESDDYLGSIPTNDVRRAIGLDKFTQEVFDQNSKLLKALYDFARQKGTSLEGLAMSYLQSLEGKKLGSVDSVVQMIPIPSASTREKIDKNFGSFVDLIQEDIDKIQALVKANPIVGGRLNAQLEKIGLLNG